ncbi:ammonia-forming cytochrome c nitrite reductase subunit c552 [Caldinitratiruptor microaerophilus]|uniref:Uncharacterized protein n=1 Tax=Caldinitratiruptor microaerophilus TaxID=671077 RepID=A0AA35G9C7_9FIRM|nr:ammonia-forming cytochrome c nitrite reductase subunit c552 [Caldinitratiruptor microaerophilus]BDG62030.1 hypothetical protein caldi_31200 [Caldinitratiruptor microaerophilus]
MLRKWMRHQRAILTGVGVLAAAAVIAVAAAASPAQATPAPADLPEYVGSAACMGCHPDEYASWSRTGHAQMLKPVFKPSDLPADPAKAPPELRAQLDRALYVVAGQRFIGRSPSGEYVYLGVVYDPAAKTYKPYARAGESWEKSCAGCHSVGWNPASGRFAEAGIGCESCHGPGRDHILGKGDRSKIVVSSSSDTCGACHVAGSMPDGTRWPVGWKPGMALTQTGFQVKAVDPKGPPPDPALHLRQYAPLQASAHATAVESLVASGHAQDSCYRCHSTEARLAAERGAKVNTAGLHDGITCVACHDPHASRHEAQLREEQNELCMDCHNGSIPAGQTARPGSVVHHPMAEMFKGVGAIGVPGESPSPHNAMGVTCASCHMTDGNHMFKVIKPAEVAGTNRKDSCVACHQTSIPEVRQAYLDMWQNTVKAKVAALEKQLAQADARLKARPGIAADLKAKVDVARTNVSFVKSDGSWGVHNFDYAVKVLGVAERNLNEFFAATR